MYFVIYHEKSFFFKGHEWDADIVNHPYQMSNNGRVMFHAPYAGHYRTDEDATIAATQFTTYPSQRGFDIFDVQSPFPWQSFLDNLRVMLNAKIIRHDAPEDAEEFTTRYVLEDSYETFKLCFDRLVQMDKYVYLDIKEDADKVVDIIFQLSGRMLTNISK